VNIYIGEGMMIKDVNVCVRRREQANKQKETKQ
jgi:hypothetical protein